MFTPALAALPAIGLVVLYVTFIQYCVLAVSPVNVQLVCPVVSTCVATPLLNPLSVAMVHVAVQLPGVLANAPVPAQALLVNVALLLNPVVVPLIVGAVIVDNCTDIVCDIVPTISVSLILNPYVLPPVIADGAV
jgi:hypothetical protein